MEISAKQLRIGFRLGIYDFDDVQCWVDFKMLQNIEPREEILELSFSKKEAVHDIYSLLSSIPNTEEDDNSLINVLGDIQDKHLNDIEFCRNLAKNLYNYWAVNDYTVIDKLVGIGDFDDVVQGVGDSGKALHSDFKEFINDFKNC